MLVSSVLVVGSIKVVLIFFNVGSEINFESG